MTWKAYAVVSGAGLFATYLFSVPPSVAPRRTAPDAARAITAPATPAVDIQDQASRLQSRVRQDTSYQEPARNPFRFAARPAAVRQRSPQLPAVAPPVPVQPVAEPPAIKLSGIATSTVDGNRQRTAILITPAGPVTVREGDAVGAERVERIEEDAVDLATPDGSRRRLSLRP